MGNLRRLTPVSPRYGFDRGLPIDRHYVEDFLGRFAGHPGYAGGDLRGRVLEVGGREYADRFGGRAGAGEAAGLRVDVLHESDANLEATIVGSLTEAGVLPEDTFDAILCTQTLHVIYDFRAALRNLHAALAPGGVLLATVPGITRSCLPDRDQWGDWWRFTSSSARRVVEEAFPGGEVKVEAYGNVLAAVGFLHGLAADELKAHELAVRDPDFEVLIAIRARKASAARPASDHA